MDKNSFDHLVKEKLLSLFPGENEKVAQFIEWISHANCPYCGSQNNVTSKVDPILCSVCERWYYIK